MEVSVAEAADALGVTPARVRQLIASDRVRARRVGGQWLVEGSSLPSGPRRSRPMSPASAWRLLDESRVDSHDPRQRYLRRLALARLAEDPEPERLLASWVASRGQRHVFASRNPSSVLDDPLFVRSGVSDPRAGISAGGVAEGYVFVGDLPMLRRAHLLRPGGAESNVIVHVVAALPPAPVPLLLLAADLADHDRPRELARARDLIRQAVAE